MCTEYRYLLVRYSDNVYTVFGNGITAVASGAILLAGNQSQKYIRYKCTVLTFTLLGYGEKL